jgi:hypothetical protein
MVRARFRPLVPPNTHTPSSSILRSRAFLILSISFARFLQAPRSSAYRLSAAQIDHQPSDVARLRHPLCPSDSIPSTMPALLHSRFLRTFVCCALVLLVSPFHSWSDQMLPNDVPPCLRSPRSQLPTSTSSPPLLPHPTTPSHQTPTAPTTSP